jgi:CheY-like chemotaxis protein
MTQHPVELLLIEDNPADAELTVHVLKKHHLANSIEIARDGAEALEFLFGAGEDQAAGVTCLHRIILLDLKLPKVNGLEVLAKVKADPRTKSIPVVVLTSSGEEQDVVNGYGMGANSYIRKPVAFEQFANTVQQIALYWLVLNEPIPK